MPLYLTQPLETWCRGTIKAILLRYARDPLSSYSPTLPRLTKCVLATCQTSYPSIYWWESGDVIFNGEENTKKDTHLQISPSLVVCPVDELPQTPRSRKTRCISAQGNSRAGRETERRWLWRVWQLWNVLLNHGKNWRMLLPELSAQGALQYVHTSSLSLFTFHLTIRTVEIPAPHQLFSLCLTSSTAALTTFMYAGDTRVIKIIRPEL